MEQFIIIVIAILLAILLAIFWCKQFLSLMYRNAASFPSREDKVLWVITLMVLNALGALLYWLHCQAEAADKPPLDVQTYCNLKVEFKQYEEELEQATQMSQSKRYLLEKHYRKMGKYNLKYIFANDRERISTRAFGILLTIMREKNIIINENTGK